MVVTRRTPAAPGVGPIPPASRSNSTQAVPKTASRTKNSKLAAANEVGNGTGNGKIVDEDDSPKKKAKQKGGKPKKQGKRRKRSLYSSSLPDLLFRYLLLFFTIYSLSVCPSDNTLSSPVCRGLSVYRKLVLDPYVLPPLNSAYQSLLAHPSVGPKVEQVKPVVEKILVGVERGIEVTKPVVKKGVEAWNGVVSPTWDKYVVPRWRFYIQPHLDDLWIKYIDPYYRAFMIKYYAPVYGNVVYYHALYQPQINTFASKTHEYALTAYHYANVAYVKSEPVIREVWVRTGPARVWLAEKAGEGLAVLGVYRRKWVDPQVEKIWEGIVELSGTKGGDIVKTQTQKMSGHKVQEGTTAQRVKKVVPEPEPVVEDLKPVETETGTVVDTEPTPVDVAVEVTESAKETPVEVVVSSGESAIKEETSSAGSYASPSVSDVPTSSPTPSQTGKVTKDTESVPTQVSDPVSVEEPVVEGTTIPEPDIDALPDLDLDSDSEDTEEDILALLGLAPSSDSSSSESEPSSSTVEVVEGLAAPTAYSPPAPPEPLSPEEDRRRREERTIRLRKETAKRIVVWEGKIDEGVRVGFGRVVAALESVRDEAVKDFKSAKDGTGGETLRKGIQELVGEAERLVGGAEKYLKGAEKKRKAALKDSEGKAVNDGEDTAKEMWEMVVEKVEEKWGERVGELEEMVNLWFAAWQGREADEVNAIIREVSLISETAQADLGMDMSWIEDITVQDWQRYHDLVRRTENFTAEAIALQAGSHPSLPTNPVLDVLAELEEEVKDVMAGFDTRLRRVKSGGEKVFGTSTSYSSAPPSSEAAEFPEETTSKEEVIEVVAEEVVDRIEKGEEPVTRAEEPVVSILPIEPEVDGVLGTGAEAIIGKGKVEVEQAMGRAEAFGEGASKFVGDKVESVKAKVSEAMEKPVVTTHAADEL